MLASQLKGEAFKALQRLRKLSGASDFGSTAPFDSTPNTMPDESEQTPEPKPFENADVKITAVRKPIMTPEVEQCARDAMTQYNDRLKWRRWGMHKVREQGTAILLIGPPGTGKTMIAKWMAKEMGKKMKSLEVATVAGGNPGDSERNVIELFNMCRKEDNCVVFMDECNSILGDRSEVSADGRTWQSSTTEQVMLQINIYPGPVICATNHAEMLDSALEDRFLFVIKVDRPDFTRRLLIWKQKWPQSFPLRLKERDYKRLARYDLSGRQIENVIVAVASNCIRTKRRPSLSMFDTACEYEMQKHIKENGKQEEED